jgi:hypothetical protein
MPNCSQTKIQRLWSDICSLFHTPDPIDKIIVEKKLEEFDADYPIVLVYLSSKLEQLF